MSPLDAIRSPLPPCRLAAAPRATALPWSALLLAALLPGGAGATEVKIEGDLRLRPEVRTNQDFDSQARDRRDFVLQRVRLLLSGTVDTNLRAVVQVQDSRRWGEEASLTSNDRNLDLHQGYLEISNVGGLPLAFLVGRQELNYGEQRLVGGFGWDNVGRSFDALRAIYRPRPTWRLDVWSAKLSEQADGPIEGERDFNGFYTSYAGLKGRTLEGYLLLDRNGARFPWRADAGGSGDGRTGQILFETLGGRIAGRVGERIEYGAEGAVQVGRNVSAPAVIGGATAPELLTVRAFAVQARGTYTLRARGNPRVGFEYVQASGDSDPTDDRRGTFANLYPTNHDKYGYIDFLSWQNMRDIHVMGGIAPTAKWGLDGDLHFFELAEGRDAWYRASGAPVTVYGAAMMDPEGGAGSELGRELDLTLRYAPRPHLALQGGYSIFWPGGFVEGVLGRAVDPSHWGFLQTTLTF